MAFDPKLLPKTPEWRALTASDREAFAKFGHPRQYRKGETIFRQGDECRGIYIICKGLVSVRRTDWQGHPATLRLARDDDIFGFRPLLAGSPHMACAEVLEDCEVGFFPASHVKKTVLNNISFCGALMRRQARELERAEARFLELTTQPLRYRLLHLLLMLNVHHGANLIGGDVLLDLPISRKEMASMIGVRTETLSREIGNLTDEGLIEFSGRRALIKKMVKVEREVFSRTTLH